MSVLLLPVHGVRLVAVESSSEYETQLRSRAHNRSVTDAVMFAGWVNFEVVPSYVDARDVLSANSDKAGT